jgi:hypothetical protein
MPPSEVNEISKTSKFPLRPAGRNVGVGGMARAVAYIPRQNVSKSGSSSGAGTWSSASRSYPYVGSKGKSCEKGFVSILSGIADPEIDRRFVNVMIILEAAARLVEFGAQRDRVGIQAPEVTNERFWHH